MKTKFVSTFDFILFICPVLLSAFGILFIYSAGADTMSHDYIKQIIWASTGVVLMLFFAFFDYRFFYKYATKAFIVICFILLYIAVYGKVTKGASSWFKIGNGRFGISFQPSEPSKIIFIFFLAKYFEKTAEDKNDLFRFSISILYLAIPVGLILLQPDIGTASVFIPIFLAMAFVANIPVRYILLFIAECACIIVFTMLPFWETEIHHEAIPAIQLLTNTKLRFIVTMTCILIAGIAFIASLFFRNKSYKWISISFAIISSSLFISMVAKKVLKPYQVMRLIVFLDPSSDPQGAGWNLIQSKTAIGSGGFFGQGFLKGLLSHNKFLPEKSTDFIFSILSEESGFIGGCIVIGLYLLMFIRILFVIRNTTTNYGYYISAGVLGMIFFHFVVNVGMVMGVMPITGIPLLFLSYGGSSMWTAMISIGLLMSIRSRRLDFQDLI